MTLISRRDWMTAGAGLAVAGKAIPSTKPVRIGFIGVGSRGTGLMRRALAHAGVEAPALCDVSQKNLDNALGIAEKEKGRRPEGLLGASAWKKLLERDDIDAVLIATPQEMHAEMSIAAMRSGKFVGSEVPACCTLDECWELVRTQEKTRAGYMLLENYRYMRHSMQVLNMAQKGVFGDLTYAECAYIHEIRGMRFKPDGTLTWRGENIARHAGDIYPTHSIGPVCGWMDINRSDRLTTLVSMDSMAAATHAFAVQKFGPDSPAAKVNFRNGDSTVTLVRTKLGRLIVIRYDTSSPRPSGMGQYALQGTKASYESSFGLHKFYIEGRSPNHQWEPAEQYAEEFGHPYWKEQGEVARRTGHGGADYFVIGDFIEAIRTGKSPIDVYDAATWSCIRPLSAKSIEEGSKALAIPDFKAGR